MMDPHTTPLRPPEPGQPQTWRRSWRSWRRPTARLALVPTQRAAPTIADATASHRDYVTEVTQLVDEHSALLFRLLTTAAAQVSTADRPIAVARAARSLTASMGTHAAVFRIEVITDQLDDLDRATTYKVGQARCLLPPSGGPAQEWVLVLQRVVGGNSGAGAAHLWMDGAGRQPLTEEMVASTLRTIFA